MIKSISKEKQLVINTIASLIVFGINLVISFFVTPYITESIGAEAYGFVSLANSFVNYATIITIALNSVGGRFISIEYHKGNKEQASKYLSSVFFSNVFMSVLVIIASAAIIFNLEDILNISPHLVIDVKLLFIFIFLNFVVSILSTVFSVATFITNKLYMSNIANVLGVVVRIVLLFALFARFSPIIYFVGLTSVIGTIVVAACNIFYTKILTPELKVKKKYFSVKLTKELFSAGIWSSITKFGQVLSDGLDLLISNIFINSFVMGQLSIAKTVGNIMSILLSTVSSLCAPNLTMYYAKGEIKKLVSGLKMSMKFTGFFANIPFCVFIVWGYEFFNLWVPSQDISLIYALAVLTIQAILISGVSTPLINVFLITNKLKVNSLFWLAISVFDIIIVILLLNLTDIGIFAIAGVSTLVGFICNLTFVPIYTSVCLGVKKTEFYPIICRYIATTIVILAVLFLGKSFVTFKITWMMLIVYCGISTIIALAINTGLFLNKHERKKLLEKLMIKK